MVCLDPGVGRGVNVEDILFWGNNKGRDRETNDYMIDNGKRERGRGRVSKGESYNLDKRPECL